MSYFYDETTNNYWEAMVPVIDVEAYIAELDTQNNIRQVPKKPEMYYDWDGTEWVENASEKTAILSERIRSERDFILKKEVDPLVTNPLRWADLTAEKQAEWAAYRTALLNVPQQEDFPLNVEWPTKPN